MSDLKTIELEKFVPNFLNSLKHEQNRPKLWKKRVQKVEEYIKQLQAENAKLNIILYHRENGLSHPDLQAEIDKSKFAELEAENKKLKESLRALGK